MPDAIWQLDTTEYLQERGRDWMIIQLIGDRSRAAATFVGAKTENGADAKRPFVPASWPMGLQQPLLRDGGDKLEPTHRDMTSELISYANSLRVNIITRRTVRAHLVRKNEQFHSTFFLWLKKYPFAKDIAWLQTNVYVFDQDNGAQHYHQSLEPSMPA
ncbi:hypothetical protein ACTXML_16905 [Glutamicibacter arilaitensis]|uniref:hypothetical protein n=1 Tax=Glutamicibacter arilaitensis TaxID=256701 RepID=UPI003FD45AD9